MSKAKQNGRGSAGSKKSRVGAILIAIVVIAAIIVLAVWQSGIFKKSKTAVTIGDESYSVGVAQFYYTSAYNQFINTYGSYASAFGLDTSRPLDQQAYGEDGETWADYFRNSAVDMMQRAILLSEKARAEGVSLSETSQEYLQSVKDQITSYCVNNNITKGNYFAAFGTGVTEKLYFEQLENMLLADDYAAHVTDQMQYSDEEIQAYYTEHQAEFDAASYRYFFFSGTPEAKTDEEGNAIEATEEETAAAMEQAAEQAKAMERKLKNGGDFTALAQEFAGEEDASTYADASASTMTDATASSMGTVNYKEWVFDEGRREGDITVSEESSGYYVLQFISSGRHEYNSMNVRQIFVAAQTLEDGTTITEEQLAAVKKEAETMLSQWQSSGQTEEEFAALADQYEGTATVTGNLYEQAGKDSLSVDVSSWVFAEGRKAGDAGVVEAENGSYLVYVVSEDEPYWKVQVESALKSEAYNTWYEEVKEASPAQQVESGMQYVK